MPFKVSRVSPTRDVLLLLMTHGVPAGVPITLLYPESSLRNGNDTLRGILESPLAVLSLLISKLYTFNCPATNANTITYTRDIQGKQDVVRSLTICINRDNPIVLYSREHIETDWILRKIQSHGIK